MVLQKRTKRDAPADSCTSQRRAKLYLTDDDDNDDDDSTDSDANQGMIGRTCSINQSMNHSTICMRASLPTAISIDNVALALDLMTIAHEHSNMHSHTAVRHGVLPQEHHKDYHDIQYQAVAQTDNNHDDDGYASIDSIDTADEHEEHTQRYHQHFAQQPIQQHQRHHHHGLMASQLYCRFEFDQQEINHLATLYPDQYHLLPPLLHTINRSQPIARKAQLNHQGCVYCMYAGSSAATTKLRYNVNCANDGDSFELHT
jgi:hypothetical protein